MTTSILASKTGKMNMGGYLKTKTAQVFTYTFDNSNDEYYRFGFIGEYRTQECFRTLEEAMNRFNHFAKQIN